MYHHLEKPFQRIWYMSIDFNINEQISKYFVNVFCHFQQCKHLSTYFNTSKHTSTTWILETMFICKYLLDFDEYQFISTSFNHVVDVLNISTFSWIWIVSLNFNVFKNISTKKSFIFCWKSFHIYISMYFNAFISTIFHQFW